MRGRYSRLRHHSSDPHGYHERITWQTFWKYELPILEAKRVGVEKKLTARGKELEAYMYCSYKMLHEKFTSYYTPKIHDLFIPNNLKHD